MEYTINDFKNDFPDDNTCLSYIFNYKFGDNFECPKCGKKSFIGLKKGNVMLVPGAGTRFIPQLALYSTNPA